MKGKFGIPDNKDANKPFTTISESGHKTGYHFLTNALLDVSCIKIINSSGEVIVTKYPTWISDDAKHYLTLEKIILDAIQS